MMILEDYIHDLKLQNGIWCANELEKISYPDQGNNLYYEIEDQSFWFKNRNIIIYELIKKYSIKGPVFDIGGGNGFVSNYLSKSGFETVLVEPGIYGCQNGKERGLNNIINSNFDTNHFHPNSIPNIGVFDVLEHIEDQDQFLRTLHTNLIPDGRLFMTVPAFNTLWSEEDNYAGHYRRYQIKQLQKLVDEFGFEMLYISYFFTFLVIPIFIFRTIPSKMGFYKNSSPKSKSQHQTNSKANILLNMLMKFELSKVKNGKRMFFGSSLLIVARKR